MARRRLGDIAVVLRSKNAGPFIVTVDIVLPTRRCMEAVARQLTAERVAEAYRTRAEDVLSIVVYPQINAVKVNLRRRVPAGSPGDTDVYGAQQHIPLALLEVEDNGVCGEGSRGDS